MSDLPKTRNMKIMRRVVRAVVNGQAPGELSSLVNPESIDELTRAVARANGIRRGPIISAAAANPYLDDNLVMLGEHVRRFAETQRVAPGFEGAPTTRTLGPGADARDGRAGGFIAPELPEADGGQGLSYVASGVRSRG